MKTTEKQCADALAALLQGCGFQFSWKRNESDPPDFVFEVNDERWAVEATELHQYLSFDGCEQSRIGADTPSERMCRRIKESAILGANRDYLINVRGPIDPAITATVVQRAREYIESGETQETWLDIDPVDHTEPIARGLLQAERESQARVSIKARLRPVTIGWWIGAAHDVMGADDEHLASNIDQQLKHSLDRMLGKKVPSLRDLLSPAKYRVTF